MKQNLLNKIVNQKISIFSWVAGFVGILITRFFLEALSSRSGSGFLAIDTSTLIHYFLFFLSFMLVFMFFLKLFVFKKNQANLIPTLALLAFSSIFIAPIIDYLYTFWSGNGLTMAYIFEGRDSILHSLLTFFGPNIHTGITMGIRVEVAIILLATSMLTYILNHKLNKSFFNLIILYVLIFIFLAAPSILSIIFSNAKNSYDVFLFFENSLRGVTSSNYLHPSLQYAGMARFFETTFNFTMSKIFFIFSSILASVWFYINNRLVFKEILKNSRPERIAHYFLMILLGITLVGDRTIFGLFNWVDWLSLIVLLLSLYFSWMFAVCVNDIVDTPIDKVSNTGRPLAQGSITTEKMREGAFIFLIASIIGGFLVGIYALFFLLAFTALYYIYSAPPTRFKLIPFFSSFLIGLCCLSVVLAGFFTFSPLKTSSAFEPQNAIAIVVIFFLWSHIRDMKDIDGDREEGVPTVPVIFGNRGPMMVAVLSSLAYLLVPVFFGSWIVWPAIIASLFNYYFIMMVHYREKFVFWVYNLFIIAIASIIFLL